jgi:anaerobic magnesium-protoporphyrin IX monomethyl ester cyclase
MRIVFVHTPMFTVPVQQRRSFWQNFDVQYHLAHPGLRHMRRNMWELPHWMHWLAGVLVAHEYKEIEVLDLYTAEGLFAAGSDTLDETVLRRTVGDHPGDVFLFSPMTVNLHFAGQISQIIKELYPCALIVYGGVAATPLARQVAALPFVDYVIADRGEIALPALLDALRTCGDVATVGNLVYRTSGDEVVRTAVQYPYKSPADVPFPKVDLFPPDVGEDIRYLRQVYALGCPYQCTFCTIQTIGRKPEYFPIDRVLSEIRAYRGWYGAHHNIYWGDETFTLNPERTMTLLEALELEGDIRYDCQTRLNCLNGQQLLRKLQKSGCQWVEIGLETGFQQSHEQHKHHMKLSAAKETLKRVRDAGLAACSFVVNGFPDQTPDDMRRSIDWVCELIDSGLLQATYLFGLVPYPGSAMFEYPERYGMTLLHRNFSLYHEDMPPVFTTPLSDPDRTYDVFLLGLDQFAQAMARSSRSGGAQIPDELDEYGTFWADPHV